MEEIGFIYVFALSVLLLSAMFYTIRDSTSVQKESATKTFLENEARLLAGTIQDVIDMHLTSPDIDYRRVVDLTSADQVYQYRMEISNTSITLISRYEEISANSNLYNPTGIAITSKVESDVSAIRISYDEDLDMITIIPVDPSSSI